MPRLAALTVLIAGTAIILQGCFVEEGVVIMEGEPVPLTQYDVVRMVRDGLPTPEIIRQIRESGTVFRLSTQDIETLRWQGVPEEVISYMLYTPQAPPLIVKRTVVVERPVVFYDPWWAWDYVYAPGFWYYPAHVGFSFGYVHAGGHWQHHGYRVRYRH